MDMLQEFKRLIDTNFVSCVDRHELKARSERLVPVPDAYRNGSPGRWLKNDEKLGGQVWLHQAKAMTIAAERRNLVISTGTASGKSLVFQAAAFRTLDENDDAAVVVFYPLKALSNDQLKSWQRAAEIAGLRQEDIVKIDGSIPRGMRAEKLENARVVLMTPDVCHAWLLNEISNPVHRAFLARVALVVIDEAHVLEGVFGSNFAYLFRRLCTVRLLIQGKGRRRDMQVIAASATIQAPDKHMNKLTEMQFEVVGEDDDGAPRHKRSVLHLATPNRKEADVAESIQKELVKASTDGSFITFVDSRQGTERLAVKTGNNKLVKPYRSGYEAQDRRNIEQALRDGHLRGVVSTSALELGIDIPHFAVGLNIKVPVTRKSFRQRLGRVGRQRPGNFAVVAEPYAFRRFGSTLAEYYDKSVEPSCLYLKNRFIQFAHARCLANEREMLGFTGRKALPAAVVWPEGFAEVFEFSYPSGPAARPQEFDQINRLGGDQPHFNYSLRSVPEDTYKVVDSRGGPTGSADAPQLSVQQAIREAFPGGIYLHMARGWRVHEWSPTSFDRVIRVSPTKSSIYPQPVIHTYVNFSIERDGIVEGRFRQGERGFLAECHLQVTERVVGYREGKEEKRYKDLWQTKPWMTPKTRDFRTTGVVMKIDEDWFRQQGVKRRVAESLRDLMLREYSISFQDIDAAVDTRIGMTRNGRKKPVSDTLVLFDATHGTLRLTEPAYLHLDGLLDQLKESVRITPPGDDRVSEDVVENLMAWLSRLSKEEGALPEADSFGDRDGWMQVYDVGSTVAYKDNSGHDMEVVGHEFIALDGKTELFYLYKTDKPMKAMASADLVQAVGDEWTMVYLNRLTMEKRESLDDEE